jgi:hypothetical protein
MGMVYNSYALSTVVVQDLSVSPPTHSTRHTGRPRKNNDGCIMERIDKEDLDEEFSKSAPSSNAIRKLLERREHMEKHHVFDNN